MVGYQGMEAERRIPAETLRSYVAAIFAGAGLSNEDADVMAEITVHTDARGIYSHGSQAVSGYVDRLLSGKINPRGRPRLAGGRGPVVMVDADGSMGHLGCVFGMRLAIERAREQGIAIAAIRNSNHCGAMSFYPAMAIAEDMLGICSTNALPSMAPWGGLDKIVGLNPIGVGIPAAEELPVILDVGFSTAARGRVMVHFLKGLPIPDGWATDEDGRPTNDAATALKGLLQPIGGPKGVGLGLVVGIISALLTGADYGTDLGSVDVGPKPGRDGQLMMAIDIAAFEDVARFKQRVDQIIRQIHASRTLPGIDRVFLPGEQAIQAEIRFRRDGIPIPDVALKGLAAAAQKVGLDSARWL